MAPKGGDRSLEVLRTCSEASKARQVPCSKGGRSRGRISVAARIVYP
jgi:hypothetical protein